MYQENPLLLTEGIHLTRACLQLKNSDPVIAHALGHDVYTQYQNYCSIKFMYGEAKDAPLYYSGCVITCTENLIDEFKRMYLSMQNIARFRDDRDFTIYWRIFDKKDGHLIREYEELIDPEGNVTQVTNINPSDD